MVHEQTVEAGRRDCERHLRPLAEDIGFEGAARDIDELARHEAPLRKGGALTRERRLVLGTRLEIFEHEARHQLVGARAQVGDRLDGPWCMDPLVGAAELGDVGKRLPPDPRTPAMPFKLNQDRRHHIPRQRHRVTNWPAYDASLRQRGSLIVWFSTEAIDGWKAEPRTTRGGQAWYSPLAILTALTVRAVFRLAYRQTEGLIGSIIGLLGLDLRVPDHTTLSRRAATLEVPRPQRPSSGAQGEVAPLHLLVDSTGVKLCGPGEWLVEKHSTRTRRSWRKLHLGLDAETGQIVASALTTNDTDDGAQVGPLLDQVVEPVTSFTGDGAYDQQGVSTAIFKRHPEAAIIVPPRSTAVPSDTAETTPTQRDRHLQHVAEHGRTAWQKASGYTTRARAEAAISRWKRVVGDRLRAHTDERRATEVDVAVHALNRMLELRRPNYARIA
jgi:Transposase DDE domain